MLENISLIKEVHEFMPVKKAHTLALKYLKNLGIEDVANKRVINCSSREIFYILLIRAMMMPQKSILIQTPYSIISNLGDIKTILCNISKLEDFKNIFIFDVAINRYHYEGAPCTIIK
jgi:ABC-type lipopolysaccharide export system ATPase subunit